MEEQYKGVPKEVKWFKIKVGMFDGDSFKRIKRTKVKGMPYLRDRLTAIWFELLDLVAKINNHGYFFNEKVSYETAEDLAIMLDRNIKEIEICLNFFKKNKMIEEKNKKIFISNWDAYQNTSTLDKIREQTNERVKRYRERQKQIQDNQKEEVSKEQETLQDTLHGVTLTHIDLDIDIDKELDKESSSNIYLLTKDFKDINNLLDETRYKQLSLQEKMAIEILKTGYDYLEELPEYAELIKGWLEEHKFQDVKVKIKYFIRCVCEHKVIGVKGRKKVWGYVYEDNDEIQSKYGYFKTSMEKNFETSVDGNEDFIDKAIRWSKELEDKDV